jgi:hypothetical protein
MGKFFFLWALFCSSLCLSQNDEISFLALGDSYTAATNEIPRH